MSPEEERKARLQAQQTVERLLNIRLRSEEELRSKLRLKGFTDTVIHNVLSHYKAIQCIDDRIFARSWIASRLKKPFGLNRIRQELRKKGVHDSIIKDEIHTAASQDYEELAVIMDLAKRRIAKYKNIEPQKIKQRIYGYLTRRGFQPENIYKAINQL